MYDCKVVGAVSGAKLVSNVLSLNLKADVTTDAGDLTVLEISILILMNLNRL